MSDPWIPFDATDDEIADLHVARERLPANLRAPLSAWIYDRLPVWITQLDNTPYETVHDLQTALRIDFGWSANNRPRRREVTDGLEAMGDATVLRAIDYYASKFRAGAPTARPAEIRKLAAHLDTGGSSVEVYRTEEGNYRLRARVPEGVEEMVQAAIDAKPASGRHLANAWRAAYALDPNESFAMTEGIRAVEAAAGPVVIPNDGKPSLGKVVNALTNQPTWRLLFHDSDGYPDHRLVLIGMLETLAKAQPDRHAGEKPSVEEARAHVMLAATLVEWFNGGIVTKAD